MKKNIIVFGGGISGLTVCHELINKGFNITLIEKDNILGGMAKSRREKNNIPSEHSWRGFGPFYKNTYELLKKIPLNNNKTCYDTLTEPIYFYVMENKIAPYTIGLSISDYIILVYYVLLIISSNNRKKEYYKIHVQSLFKKILSKDGYTFLVELGIGPTYGMEKKDASLGHFLYFTLITLLNNHIYKHAHTTPKYYIHQSDNSWHVLDQPIHEAWFNPWSKYLQKNNINILLNTELVKINYINNKIVSCIIKNTSTNIEEVLKADEYIICINPFVAEQVFKNSNMIDLYKQHHLLNKKTTSNQISFRLGFNKKIKLIEPRSAYVFSDSNFNITIYPQDAHWKSDIKLDDLGIIKSLWSGTCLELYRKSNKDNKLGLNLTKEEFIEDIKEQIIRSKSFQKLIFDLNNFYLTIDDITYSEVWYEWNFNNETKKLEQTYKKWVNNIYNEDYRPHTTTIYKNMLLAGSHTKTSINIYSMEGAVESGKKAAIIIDKKYNKISNIFLYKHKENQIFDILKYIDDLLYNFNLPNIINIILIISIIFIIKKILKRI